VFVAGDVTIGNNVKIQNNVSLYTGVTVEDEAFLGPSMVFTNVVNPRSHVNRKEEYKPTLVKRGASIGANATVVCGTTLGQYCFIGAGAVVTRDVPDFALVYGNPGRVQGWMCQCGIRLDFQMAGNQETALCGQCGSNYVKTGQVVKLIGKEAK
jgi:UDP-2-acetamido-3-amino-2,3-dideoxy-glucuronate N-acetyltransferase